MNDYLKAAARGAGAGAAATLPMSGVMLAAGKAGLMGKQPPETIFESMLGALRFPIPDEKTEGPLVVAAHIGYGMLAGAAFGLLWRRAGFRLPAFLGGAGYGVLLWALSYHGWIPALHIMPPPERDRPGRPASMIAAHVVYGAALGALADGGDRG